MLRFLKTVCALGAAFILEPHCGNFIRKLRVMPLIAGRMAIHGRVLDLGCGKGDWLRMLGSIVPGLDLHGIDPAAVPGSGPPGARITACRAEEYRPEGAFDLVYSIDVIDDIPDDEGALRCVHGWLRSGGVFIVHAPCYEDPSPATRGSDKALPEVSVHFYGQDDVTRKMTGAGFRLERVTRTIGGIEKTGHGMYVAVHRWPWLWARRVARLAYNGMALIGRVVQPRPRKGAGLLVIARKE